MADTFTKQWGIGGRTITITTTRALDCALGDYAAEDVVSDDDDSGEGTALIFEGIASKVGGAGYITKAGILCSQTGLAWGLTLYLFRVTPTSCELDDNDVNTAVHTTDRPNYVGKIDFPAMSDLGGNSETEATPSTVGNLPLAFNCAADDDDLYGVLVTRDGESSETNGMTIVVSLTSEIQ